MNFIEEVGQRWSVFEQYVALIDIFAIPKRSQVLMGMKGILLLHGKYISKSPQPPFGKGGQGGIYDFHISCLHTEVPCFACLREATSAKAGHAGVGGQIGHGQFALRKYQTCPSFFCSFFSKGSI